MSSPSPRFLVVFLLLWALPANLLVGLPSVAAQSAKPSTTQTTDSSTTASTQKPPDYSGEAFVVEEVSTRHRYEKDGTGQRIMGLRAKIQSEAGVQGFGQLVFPYISTNEKLDIQMVRVIKPDGTSVNGSESDVQDLNAPVAREAPIYTDLRQKHVTVRGLRPGDTLEYRVVSQLHTPMAVNHFWLEHNFVSKDLIVLNDVLEVDIPAESRIKLKTEKGFEPVMKPQAERVIYSWKRSNLKREEAKPPDEDKDEEDEDAEPPRPHVQLSTFQNWDEVGRWYAGLERDRIVPDEKIRLRTAELLRGRNTEIEKAEALYQFVAKNFRYVSLSLGHGRYQPHAAADVMANQYGDCKDKHTLLAAMLSVAGLRAYPALINSSRKIDPDIPSPGQFDHVITAIPIGAKTFWMDTTSEVAPFQLLAPTLRDKQALLIPASGPARLETTPAVPPFLFTEVVEINAKLSELGKITGHAKLKVRGDAETIFRSAFRSTPQSNWKELGPYLSMGIGIKSEVTEIKTSDPAVTDGPFEIEFDFSAENQFDWSGKKATMVVPLPSLYLRQTSFDKSKGSKPIKIGVPAENIHRLKLTFPEKYLARSPLPVKVGRDYADYSSSYKVEGNTLIAERTFSLREREIPSARAHDYAALVAATRADEGQKISLEAASPGAPMISDSVKVEELIQSADAAAKNLNYSLVEELLKRVVEKEPDHKFARRQLGWAFFAQRKFEAAVSTLREQTKINPFDDVAYTLLGRIFWQQEKYAEAEASFRKQIEVSPLDKLARTNLALMLIDWRKYKEAVPELEQAISLTPDSESLYVALGTAQLNLGNKEKGMEAFEQAIKLAPGPSVWNNIAYALAVKDVELDRAQQYAESAVSGVATELRNVELANLSMDHLLGVSQIAAFWDTLGWVHFKKGNLPLAEKYIRAAWILGQHGVVGNHLGEILEKRGKKDEAIKMYALAAASFRSTPEAKENLVRLAGKEKSEALWQQSVSALNASRVISISPVTGPKGATQAQFFVVLVPNSDRSAQVADVKFISGDEKYRSFGGLLKNANFNFTFPDESAVKIIRRGTLYCQGPANACTFTLLTTDSVTLE